MVPYNKKPSRRDLSPGEGFSYFIVQDLPLQTTATIYCILNISVLQHIELVKYFLSAPYFPITLATGTSRASAILSSVSKEG